MSRSLGVLTLDLIARVGAFEQGMDKAERRAKKSAKGIKDSADEASSAWAGLGKVAAGAFAGVSVGGLFTRFIAETRNAEQEQAQLAAVLRSTGEAAGFTQDQLNSMASSMEGSSIISAGEFSQAQTALLAFTGIIGDQFPRALQAAADMSARTGLTVTAAAETIGRALDVPSQGMASLTPPSRPARPCGRRKPLHATSWAASILVACCSGRRSKPATRRMANGCISSTR